MTGDRPNSSLLPFRLGCAVWGYSGWRGSWFPADIQPKAMLPAYAQCFTAVEGNTTFYGMPSPSTVDKWRSQTPAPAPSGIDFHFCLKLPKTISHQGLLMPQWSGAQTFIDRINRLGDRLGPAFLQLPPRYSPQYFDDLDDFLGHWQAQTDAKLAVEVRHPDWFTAEGRDRLNRLLLSNNIGRVILDTRPIYRNLSPDDDPQALSQRRKPDLPLHASVTAPFSLVRFISHPDPAKNQGYLDEWANRAERWLSKGITLYFFVHCPIEDHSPHTARQFQERLIAKNLAIPTLQWPDPSAAPPDEQPQLSLFSNS
ncbi:MAG: DUF72 domain-containing protein [Cyanobacteria bacterium P01_D01_bin.73]